MSGRYTWTEDTQVATTGYSDEVYLNREPDRFVDRHPGFTAAVSDQRQDGDVAGGPGKSIGTCMPKCSSNESMPTTKMGPRVVIRAGWVSCG